MPEEILISERFLCEGAEVLRVRIALPKKEVYEEAARRAFAYCSGELFRIASEEYIASPDPKKRFYYPAYIYSLNASARHEGEREYVTLCARLSRRGERAALYSYSDTHVWQGGSLCPVKKVRESKRDKKEK